MKSKIILSVFASTLTLFYHSAAFSACATGPTQCYKLKDGKVISTSKCEYSNCANANGASTIWKLPNGTVMVTREGSEESGYGKSGNYFNEKPASVSTQKAPDGKKNMTCYKTGSGKELNCGVVPRGVF